MVGAGSGVDDDDWLVAVFPPVAERAVEHRLAPPVGEAVDRWELVVNAGGQHHCVAVNGGAVRELSSTRCGRCCVALVTAERTIATPYECSSASSIRAEAIGGGRVAGGEAVELVDGRVAVRLVVDHGDPMPGPCQHECCGEAGGPAADDQHVAGNVACGAVHDADTSSRCRGLDRRAVRLVPVL